MYVHTYRQIWMHLWTKLAETIANVIRDYHGTGKGERTRLNLAGASAIWIQQYSGEAKQEKKSIQNSTQDIGNAKKSTETMLEKKEPQFKRGKSIYPSEFQT